jgi:DNA-binding MarR family transcriptional regulator
MSENLDRDVCTIAAEQCGCTNIRKASRAVTRFFDEYLEGTGFTSTQMAILVTIAALQPASLAKLARELVMEPSTLNRNIRPLESRGLVTKQSQGMQRRSSVSLTEQGEAALLEAIPVWRSAQERFVGAIGQENWDLLRHGLSDAISATRLT